MQDIFKPWDKKDNFQKMDTMEKISFKLLKALKMSMVISLLMLMKKKLLLILEVLELNMNYKRLKIY